MRRSLIILVLGLACLSCEVSNPVAPPAAGGGVTPGSSGAGAAEFNILIELPVGVDVIVDAQPIPITITVTTVPGQTATPVGQIFAVTTTLGSLDVLNSKEFTGVLNALGIGVVNFFPGNTAGDAQLFVSVGNTVETRVIVVKPKPEAPVADFAAQISDLKVLFTNMSTGTNLSYQWHFGDGCKFDANATAPETCTGCAEGTEPNLCEQTDPLHEYATAGAYAVRLTASDPIADNPASDRTQLIDVGTLPEPAVPPVAMFTAEPQPGGLQVIFRDASTGPPTSWNWDFGDGGTSAAQNPVHTFPSAGEFLVSLTVSNSAGTNNTSQFVPVGADIPELKADFTFVVSASGLIVTFTDTTTGASHSHLWEFGDGGTSTERNPIHEYISADEYQVRLTVTDAGGASSTAQKLVAAGAPPPTADFDWTPKKTGTDPTGLRIVFNDASTGNPTMWSWNFDDGSTATCTAPDTSCVNPVHDYLVSGSYGVKLTVSNTGGSNDITKLVEVDSGQTVPESRFTFTKIGGLTVDFNGSLSTGGNLSYLWDFGDSASPDNSASNPNPIHTFSTAADFVVTLTVSNGEGSSSSSQTVRFLVPVADFSFQQSGTTGIFTDQSSGDPVKWTWTFADSTGTTLPAPPTNPVVITTAPGDTTYDFGAAGTYQVTLEIENAGGETDDITKTVTIVP